MRPAIQITMCFLISLCVIAAPAAGSAVPSLTPQLAAGQMVGIGISDSVVTHEIDRWVRDRAVGMIVLYRGSVRDEESARKLTAGIRARASRPELAPLIATDQEGGSVIRLAPAMLPGNLALAATADPALAERAGRHVGCVLRRSGITMNFAPTVDLVPSTDPAGIGTRSFGDDPASVSRFAAAYVLGLSETGVLAVPKHFPGHGSASADTHFAEASDFRSRDELAPDLAPFKAAIAAGAAGVMVGHVRYPNWEETSGLPATLSRAIVRALLREELGFDGLIITDVVHMEGVAHLADPGELALRAIEAGADVVLASRYADRQIVYDAILGAIRSGRLSHRRVEESARRVLAAKQRALVAPSPCEEDPDLAARIARAAVTRIDPRGVLPVSFDEASYIGTAGPLADRFPSERRVILPVVLTGDLTDRYEREIRSRLEGGRPIVVSIMNRSHAELARRVGVAFPDTPLVVVALGFPADAGSIQASAYLFAYSFLEPSQLAVAEVLTRNECAPGRLPIAVPGIAAAGAGDSTCRIDTGAAR